MHYTEELIKQVLSIGISLTVEKDREKLLSHILHYSMEIANADAGTLYILKEGFLHFAIVRTISMHVDKVFEDGSDADRIPPVPPKEENICAYCAMHKKVLNIKNVYDSDEFNFAGPKKYDAMTGYHTVSMVVIPLVDQDEKVLGVLQLINSMDERGQIVPFAQELMDILMSLASQASVALSNMQYREDLQEQMWSFTEAMTEMIDSRTPYNASHSRNVAKYVGLLANYINKLHEESKTDDYFTTQRKDSLLMGAYLHDIGKMAIPTAVMNKAKRLGSGTEEIEKRLDAIALHAKIDLLQGVIDEDAYRAELSREKRAIELAGRANEAESLDDGLLADLTGILSASYTCGDGTILPYFTESEQHFLQIRKGTLTNEERRIMESHAAVTRRILSKVHFGEYFADSPIWAAQHHECLDGSGYPEHLKAEDLALESRMMAVADICDALLATDRPYKKPMPREKAFAIM
nr:GAF domain-containing protein [Lachnospiraceae bacterium]